MRLRNVKGADEKLNAHPKVINQPELYKGKWKVFFKNDNPIQIELGMGKGQFIIQKAQNNPNINFIGFEKMSSVLVKATEKVDNLPPLDNLFFIRYDVENITEVFDKGEVDCIYLNFSDPWPKERHAKRRLTAITFLEKYRQIIAENGRVIQKTDNENLYNFSKEQMIKAGYDIEIDTNDLHHSPYLAGNIMTEYEQKFVALGKPIYMIKAIIH